MKRPSKSQFWIMFVGLVLQIMVPLTELSPARLGTEDPAKFYSAFPLFSGPGGLDERNATIAYQVNGK